MITVEVTGDFLVESSLARVNRGLFGALSRRRDIDLGILTEPTAAPIMGSSDDALLEAARLRRFLPDPQISIRHRWPAVFPRIRDGAYVHMQPWEFGSLPVAWAQGAKDVADDVWCYSKFIADMNVRAGVPPERVHVIPLGFDPEVYKPGPAPMSATLRDRVVFLYVGDTIPRKGVDVAVNAYISAFAPNESVVFIVKDFGGKETVEGSRFRDHIKTLSGRRDIPPILYVDSYYSDAALADLYRAASVLVAPYRGEGFGLPILEAMACGVATIATRGGASDDFTTKDTTSHVNAAQIKLGRTYNGLELVDDAFLLEPVEAEVGAAMRRFYDTPDLARKMGARAAEVAQDWTWAKSAEHALARLQALAQQTPLAKKRDGAASGIQPFELKIASRGGEDGVLLELFRRLGVDDPIFVECVTPGGEPSISVFLSRALGWRGAVLRADSALYAEFASHLATANVPKQFELLVLTAESDPAWSRFGDFRPKVVVTTDGASAPRALAESHGYTYIGSESHGTSAFFVRSDLLERSRFQAA